MTRGSDAVCGHSVIGQVGRSVLTLESANCLVLRLRSRKNRQSGASIRRFCICKEKDGLQGHPLCPVHALWHQFFAPMEPGEQPWSNISPSTVNVHLRATLKRLGVGG